MQLASDQRKRELELAELKSWLKDAEPQLAGLRNRAQTTAAAVAAVPGRRQAAAEAVRQARAGVERDRLRAEISAAAADEQRRLTPRKTPRGSGGSTLASGGWRASPSELAGELHEGEPCRVCGSPLEHPAPAHGDGADRVDRRRRSGRSPTGSTEAA